MASNSAEVDSVKTISDSEATISDTSSDVPVDEIPPPVLDAQEEEEEEVAMKQINKEVELPQTLKEHPGIKVQDWRAFASKRLDGHTDRTYIHKEYRRKFRSIPDVQRFVDSKGVITGEFDGKKLQKKKRAGMDVHDAGTSKSAGRRASANHARPKRSRGAGHFN